jgi:DNA processing protein
MDITPFIILSHFFGIGPVRFQQLLNKFKSVDEIIKADKKELTVIIGDVLTQKFYMFKESFKADSILSEMSKKHIQVLCYGTKEYPKSLGTISDPPICLYAIGDTTILNDISNMSIAIVGSRRMTSYGKQVVEHLISGLIKSNVIIISGLAHGIDGEAHRQTLLNKGKTVAVLGCGVDIPHPVSHRKLYEQIITQGGCIISEFPPGHLVKPGLFVARNRIISGLSNGVVIIEGSNHSGSLITARYAGDQGRDVFAVPGPINSILSEAPNYLIKHGAIPVTSAQDILDYYGVKTLSSDQKKIRDSLNEVEQIIFDYISGEPQTPDELCRILHLPITQILALLSSLQLKGIVSQNSEEKFVRKL